MVRPVKKVYTQTDSLGGSTGAAAVSDIYDCLVAVAGFCCRYNNNIKQICIAAQGRKLRGGRYCRRVNRPNSCNRVSRRCVTADIVDTIARYLDERQLPQTGRSLGRRT